MTALAVQYAPVPEWLLWTVVVVGCVSLLLFTIGSVGVSLAASWFKRRELRRREVAALSALEQSEAWRRSIRTAAFGDHGEDFIAWTKELSA